MKKINITDLKVGQTVVAKDGMVTEVKNVSIVGDNAAITLDGGFSMSHHGRDYVVDLKSNGMIYIID